MSVCLSVNTAPLECMIEGQFEYKYNISELQYVNVSIKKINTESGAC